MKYKELRKMEIEGKKFPSIRKEYEKKRNESKFPYCAFVFIWELEEVKHNCRAA